MPKDGYSILAIGGARQRFDGAFGQRAHPVHFTDGKYQRPGRSSELAGCGDGPSAQLQRRTIFAADKKDQQDQPTVVQHLTG